MLPGANEKNPNGYILVNANGGLNQMRDGVSNYLNLNAIFHLYLKCPNLIPDHSCLNCGIPTIHTWAFTI